jgi:hypothetical protein
VFSLSARLTRLESNGRTTYSPRQTRLIFSPKFQKTDDGIYGYSSTDPVVIRQGVT